MYLSYEVVQCITLVENGCSMRYVARVLGVQPTTVSKRTTTPQDDDFLRLTALRTRPFTAKFFKKEF